jgi:NAD-dependent DNA ligase
LYNGGYYTVLSILEAASESDETPYEIDGLGSRMVQKIYGEIDRVMMTPSFNVTLPKIMSGSLMFGMGMGVRKLRDLLKHIPDLLTKYDTSKVSEIKKDILEVPGYSNISASKVARNLKKFTTFLDEIRDSTKYTLEFTKPVKKTVTKTATKAATKGKKATKSPKDEDSGDEADIDFTDQKVVLTGFRDADITEFIESNGGTVTSSVSSKTTLVIYVPTPKKSSKLQKAEDLGITMMTREEFAAKYGL